MPDSRCWILIEGPVFRGDKSKKEFFSHFHFKPCGQVQADLTSIQWPVSGITWQPASIIEDFKI
jgi:hypothetical protein